MSLMTFYVVLPSPTDIKGAVGSFRRWELSSKFGTLETLCLSAVESQNAMSFGYVVVGKRITALVCIGQKLLKSFQANECPTQFRL
jgi:hypothetical protein